MSARKGFWERVITLRNFGGGKRRPINLFFAEIIIALLFFSISGAVILRVFAAADSKSRRSARLERVILFAQSFAEAYSESGSAESAAELLALNYERSGAGVTAAVPDNANVRMAAEEERAEAPCGTLSQLTMRFFADDEEIYSLSCTAYSSGGGGVG